MAPKIRVNKDAITSSFACISLLDNIMNESAFKLKKYDSTQDIAVKVAKIPNDSGL